MITEELEFLAPADLGAALKALAERPYGAKALAGGMSLVPMMNLGLARPEAVVSLSRIPELAFISDDGNAVRIGSMTTHRELATSEIVLRECEILSKAAGGIGDVQVRNRGTLGGSLAHADPAADYLPVFIACGARCEVASTRGSRWIDADALALDIMQTSLEPDELILHVEFPKLPEAAGTAFARFVRVEGNYAIVTAAALSANGRLRAVVGGATPTPICVDANTADVAEIGSRVYDAASETYGDIAGDAEYRRAMARVFAQRVAEEALPARGRRLTCE